MHLRWQSHAPRLCLCNHTQNLTLSIYIASLEQLLSGVSYQIDPGTHHFGLSHEYASVSADAACYYVCTARAVQLGQLKQSCRVTPAPHAVQKSKQQQILQMSDVE